MQKLCKAAVLGLLLLIFRVPALGALDSPQAVTQTVKIAGLEVVKDYIIITPKTGYVHLLWDAFPSRAAIQTAGKAFALETAARELVRGPGLTAVPGAAVFKVAIVEFYEKDSYGAKRWDKVRSLGSFELTLNGKNWILKKWKSE